MQPATPSVSNLRHRWLREPFLHFLILGGALFLLSQWLEERTRVTRIVVTKSAVAGLAHSYRLQFGRDPTPVQLEALIEGDIREEMAYREAVRLGLGDGDEIVRRRLAQKYEFLQQDLAISPDPPEAQLRAYFAQHRDGYSTPETVAFSQVYFSTDRRGEAAAHLAADSTAAGLNSTGKARAPDTGDPFPGPAGFTTLSAVEAERVFGRGTLTEMLFRLRPGEWSVPLRSAYGWHVLHVDGYQPARPAIFSAVVDQVRRDYLEDARERRNEAAYAQLLEKFEIVRE